MKHILLLEDDTSLGEGIRCALEHDGVCVELCDTLSQARDCLNVTAFDLLILDINLPDGSGIDFLRDVRLSGSDVPVILLTANDLETDIVMGLESGADDYVTKPFSLAVLRARVNTQLRRGAPVQIDTFMRDGFSFNFTNMEFLKNGVPIQLSRTEQKLLRMLISCRGLTLTRDALMNGIWTDSTAYVDRNALSVAVNRLRGKLEDDPSSPRYLKTVYGIGYTWAVK